MCVRNLWQKYTAIMMSKDSTKLQFQERKYLPDGCPQRSLCLMQDQLYNDSFVLWLFNYRLSTIGLCSRVVN